MQFSGKESYVFRGKLCYLLLLLLLLLFLLSLKANLNKE